MRYSFPVIEDRDMGIFTIPMHRTVKSEGAGGFLDSKYKSVVDTERLHIPIL